jgi:purine-binding chemotaxis protein CheW
MNRAGDMPVTAEMLSDDAIRVELERRRARVAAVAADDAAATVAALCWTLAGTTFALPLAAVSGVVAMPRVTAVPEAPAAMIGIFGRRGVINSLFDPAAALGMTNGGAGADGAVILLRGTRPRVAIRVDAVLAVVDVPVERPDEGISRIATLADGGRVTIVDTGRLIGQLTARAHRAPLAEG